MEEWFLRPILCREGGLRNMKCLEYSLLGFRDSSLNGHEIFSMQEVFMIGILVRNGIRKKNWVYRKTKTVFDVGFDFEIFENDEFENNEFENNKSTRYLCELYYRCDF
jgi:hypothetical protein